MSNLYTLTQPAILGLSNLLVPRKFKDNKGRESGEPKYSAQFALDPKGEDLAAIKKLLAQTARENPKWAAPFDLAQLAFPIVAGTEVADKLQAKGKDGEAWRNKVILKASTGEEYPPHICYMENGQLVDMVTAAQQATVKRLIYIGAEVFGQFSFKTYDVGSNKPGINAYLQMVLVTGKATEIGRGPRSGAEVFKNYVGKASAVDPIGDDDIPF